MGGGDFDAEFSDEDEVPTNSGPFKLQLAKVLGPEPPKPAPCQEPVPPPALQERPGSLFREFAYGSHNGETQQRAPLIPVQTGRQQQVQRGALLNLARSKRVQGSCNATLSESEDARSASDTDKRPGKRRLVIESESDDDTDVPLDDLKVKVDLSKMDEEEEDAAFAAQVQAAEAAEAVRQEELEQQQQQEPDQVLAKCEGIAARIRGALGQQSGADRYAAASGSELALVTGEEVAGACGGAAAHLKPYQLVGVNFLLLLARSGVGGAILADEMGLGKTAQAVCYLGVLRELQKDSGPHLIVTPASLIENWGRELRRWCPSLKVVTYYGKDRQETRHNLEVWRREHLGDAQPSGSDSEAEDSEEEEYQPDGNGAAAPASTDDGDDAVLPEGAPFNVMLTCYTLFERVSEEQNLDRAFLRRWRWSHLLMDEAHAIKNRNSSRSKRLLKVAERCRRRIMLTGTPLQNDLGELQNLLHFLLPDVFKDDDSDSHLEAQDEEGEARLAERMRAVLGPFVLRRLKSEVASQLTPKTHLTQPLAMTPAQAALYSETIATMRAEAQSAGPAGKSKAGAPAAPAPLLKRLGRQKINNMFTHLRKIAQHPLLVRHLYTDDKVLQMARLAHSRGLFGEHCRREQVVEELMGYSDFRLHSWAAHSGSVFKPFLLDPAEVRNSAKFGRLAELLPMLQAAGSRPLIFSQWTAVLDVAEALLQQLRLPYVRLDGSTEVTERLATVDTFNKGKDGVFAFLLSTRAGGQGLNLVGADTVILHDVDFNPQIDRQSEDRCHRLGQTKPVTVYRLVTSSTVDEQIHAIAQRKLRLDAAVLDGVTSGAAAGPAAAKAGEAQAMGDILQAILGGSAAEDSAAQGQTLAGAGQGAVEAAGDAPGGPIEIDC